MSHRDQLISGLIPSTLRPYLLWTLPAPMRSLSWALQGGGHQIVQQVCWIQVSPQDLSIDTCPKEFLATQLQNCDATDALGLMTSAHIKHFAKATATVGQSRATAVTTVGLGNALRAGDPSVHERPLGTINCACWVDTPLSFSAMLEALVISAEAKTLAVMEAGIQSVVSQSPATGTGTDCHVILCPDSNDVEAYAGKHTNVGSAIGAAVTSSVAAGIRTWIQENPGHTVLRRESTLSRFRSGYRS